MNIIIFFSILLFCGAILLPNHYFPWLTAYQDFLAFFSLILLGLVINFYDKFENIKIEKKLVIFFTTLVIIILIQFLTQKIYFFGDILITLIYILGLFFSIIIGSNLVNKFNSKNILYIFSYVIVFCSIFSIYFMLKQWLLLNNGGIWIADLPLKGRPFANFAQPNNCATFLCMGLISSLYLYEEKYIGKFCGVLLASFILFGITLTQSRTIWVFTIVFLVWWVWKTNYFRTRVKRWSIFYFVGIYFSLIITLPYISNCLGVVGASDILERATTGHLRIPMWHQMLLAIKNEPLWGYGWNQVSVAQISVFLEYPTTEWTEHSHNILLDLLLWNGIPLGVGIISYLGFWLYNLSKLAINIENFIALSVVGVVLVHAMLEYPLEYAFFLLPVGLLLGLVQAADKNIKTLLILPKYMIGGFLALFSILYIGVFLEYRILEKDVQLVRYESLNIGNVHAKQDAPNIMLLTQLREQVRLIRTLPVRNMSGDQLEDMRKITYRYATSAALYRYAQALALNNQPELAKKHLLILEKLHGKKFSFESLFQVNKSLAFEWKNESISKP